MCTTKCFYCGLLSYVAADRGAAMFGFENEYGGGVFPRNVDISLPDGTVT
jgi:hypothetical protein